MSKRRILVSAGLIAFLALPSAMTGAGERDNSKKEARAEMKFGYQAARRGYWQEALLRFERANELTPGQARILNNIAVAQEANGLFEEALLTYQTGLAVDPRDSGLRKNLARFQEFYASYIARPEDKAKPGEPGEEADNAQTSG